jgi:transposase
VTSVLIKTGNIHVDDLIVLTKKHPNKTYALLADKGYVSAKLKNVLQRKHYNLIYPTKKNMKPELSFNKTLYKKRIYIEHSFQKLKLFKRIQLRYDSSILKFASFIFLAASQLIFRKLYNCKIICCYFSLRKKVKFKLYRL